jgi:hypothetical protein
MNPAPASLARNTRTVATEKSIGKRSSNTSVTTVPNLGDAPRPCEMPQSEQKNPRFIRIFQRRFEVLSGKRRVSPEPPNSGLIVGGTSFTLHGLPVLINYAFICTSELIGSRRQLV